MDHHNFNPSWRSNQHIPFPNRPPYLPSPSDPRFRTPQNIQESPTLPLDQKNEDELWVQSYLTKIGKININPKHDTIKMNNKSLKIHVAKSLLHRCINLLQELQKLEEYLKENVANLPSSDWKQKTIEIAQKKDEFTSLLSQFDNISTLNQLKYNLNKRKRKRLLQKNKKQHLRKENKEKLLTRKNLHKKIDQWLENMKDDVERTKREETLQKDADCVLSEVNKKKSDARKQLALLNTLVKLRAVREQTAVANGEKINLGDSKAFKENTEKLQNMWEKALEQYSLEENGLKEMLKMNEDDVDKTYSKERRITMDWETVLFGPKEVPSQAYGMLMCAEKHIRTFIAIRKSWDTFLVPEDHPEGSRIPIGWVLPKDTNAWLSPSK